MDVMLDLETLSTRPDAVILTLGAVKFDPFTLNHIGNGLYLRVDVDEQAAQGRHIQEDTLIWWSQQADDVREEALSDENRVSVSTLLHELNKFLVGVESIWCQGPVFDICILENLYRQYQTSENWQYWQIRDSRTLFAVHGDPRGKNKVGLHNALEDCISQANAVQKIYADFEIKPRFERK